jgi:DNA-binding response OmpR family regulator
MEMILVHERDSGTLEMITAALQMHGYRVCSLTDNDGNLIATIRQRHARLVLLDCWLNNAADQRTLQWIKSHFPAVPVIALSCDKRIGEQYRQLGFDDYLDMPFDLETLYRLVGAKLPRRKGSPANSSAARV